MHAHDLARIRIGLLALPLAGLVLTGSALTRGQLTHPRQDPLAFAEQVTAAGFAPSALGLITGLVLVVLGLPALHAYLDGERSGPSASLGTVLSLAGAALLLPLAGAWALAIPSAGEQFLAGRPGALDVAFGLFEGSARWMMAAAAVLFTLGQISLGLAIWRASLPRVAAVLIAPSGALLTIPLWPGAELAGAACLALAGAVLGVQVWRTPSRAPAEAEQGSPALRV